VELEARLDERIGDAFFLSGKVTIGGKSACTLNYVVTMAPKQ
jgi:hypothetical protein